MKFRVRFNIENECFRVKFGEITRHAMNPYGGPYIAVPKPNEQTVLLTKDKSMADDVTVLEIPYESVSNPQGGNTVTIGGY